jgi:acetolactate synthase-1/2/3 large subunit
MAYGYAQSTGKVGVYSVVPGPGLLNSSAALCTAWGNNSPVLCVSGQIPSRSIGKGYGELHEIDDQMGMISHLTKWSERISHPSHTPQVIDGAFRELNTGRPRPVEIEMPMDTMGISSEVNTDLPDTDYLLPAIDTTALDQAAELLSKAKRPLIVVGSGAIGAKEVVRKLAEKLQAPVASKRNGKGIISCDHYLHANLPMGHTLWGSADVVLAVGTRLKDQLTVWGKDDELKLIRVEIDPVEMTRICEPDIGILGDSKQALTALDELITVQNDSRESELQSLRAEIDVEMHEHVGPQMAYLDAIRDVLPKDGIFVDEVTQCGFASWFGFPVYEPRQHITASEMGTLGFGFATGLGVAAGNPGKKVVQISGDGGFMFNVQELSTAAEYQLDLVTIIFNDNKFGNVQRQQDEWFGGRRLCSDLHNPDFVKLAEVFGVTGLRANDPAELRIALEQGFSTSGPVIIEVPVAERMPSPWRFIMMPQNRKAVCA